MLASSRLVPCCTSDVIVRLAVSSPPRDWQHSPPYVSSTHPELDLHLAHHSHISLQPVPTSSHGLCSRPFSRSLSTPLAPLSALLGESIDCCRDRDVRLPAVHERGRLRLSGGGGRDLRGLGRWRRRRNRLGRRSGAARKGRGLVV